MDFQRIERARAQLFDVQARSWSFIFKLWAVLALLLAGDWVQVFARFPTAWNLLFLVPFALLGPAATWGFHFGAWSIVESFRRQKDFRRARAVATGTCLIWAASLALWLFVSPLLAAIRDR